MRQSHVIQSAKQHATKIIPRDSIRVLTTDFLTRSLCNLKTVKISGGEHGGSAAATRQKKGADKMMEK